MVHDSNAASRGRPEFRRASPRVSPDLQLTFQARYWKKCNAIAYRLEIQVEHIKRTGWQGSTRAHKQCLPQLITRIIQLEYSWSRKVCSEGVNEAYPPSF
jgi:hypothetical protein